MPKKKQDMVLKQLDHHRNGVGGVPFHVAIVEDRRDGKPQEMLVVRFDGDDCYVCAFSLEKLDKREIRFYYNSFRGDHFDEFMDKSIKEYPDGLHAPYEGPTEER